MKELRVTLRVRNNRLVQRREELGMSQVDFAERVGLSNGLYCQMECLRYRPVDDKGEWKSTARAVAEFHGLPADELWPEAVCAIIEPVQTREFDTGELRHVLAASSSRLLEAAPDEALEQTETVAQINKVVGTLTEREQLVLRQSFGLDGQEEAPRPKIAASLKVCRSRLAQIENKAVRRLRRPSRKRVLEDPLPREPPDPEKQLRYGPWTPDEAQRVTERIERLGRIAAARDAHVRSQQSDSRYGAPTGHAYIDWALAEKETEEGRSAQRKELAERQRLYRECEEKLAAQEAAGIKWLEYAVSPLPLAHAFVLTGVVPPLSARRGLRHIVVGSIEDDQPSLCGEMVAWKAQPHGPNGAPLQVSYCRDKCPRCAEMLLEQDKKE